MPDRSPVVNHNLPDSRKIFFVVNRRGVLLWVCSTADLEDLIEMSEAKKKVYASDRHASPRWAVQLPARFKGPLVELARARGVTTTELLAEALENYLAKNGKK
jgi:hypothetical protein